MIVTLYPIGSTCFKCLASIASILISGAWSVTQTKCFPRANVEWLIVQRSILRVWLRDVFGDR